METDLLNQSVDEHTPNRFGLDDTLAKVDLYRTDAFKHAQILRKHGIKLRGDELAGTLRNYAVTLKAVVKLSQKRQKAEELAVKVLNREVILTPKNRINYPEIGKLYDIIQIQDELISKSDSESSNDSSSESEIDCEPIAVNEREVNTPDQIMAEHIPLISAGSFSGLPSENCNDFIDKYQLASESNKWQPQTKLTLFQTHLQGTALSWFKHYKSKQPNQTIDNWETLKRDFIEAFTPLAQSQNLQLILERKFQGEDEPSQNYFLDVIMICRRYQPDITDQQIIQYVLQGLKPVVSDRVLTMKNDTLTNLEANLKEAELYVMAQQRNRYRYANQQKIQESSSSQLINQLQAEVQNLTSIVANLTTNESQPRGRPLERNDNRKYNNTFSSNSRSPYRQDRYRSPTPKKVTFQSKQHDAHARSPCSSNSRMSLNRSRSGYSQSPRRPQNQYNFSPRLYCKICNKTNHSTDKCWFKTNSRPVNNPREFFWQSHNQNNTQRTLFCNYCKRTNHTVDNCFRLKPVQNNRRPQSGN